MLTLHGEATPPDLSEFDDQGIFNVHQYLNIRASSFFPFIRKMDFVAGMEPLSMGSVTERVRHSVTSWGLKVS